MFEFEACEVLKIKESRLKRDDSFQNKHNEEIGHYGQTLNIVCSLKSVFSSEWSSSRLAKALKSRSPSPTG